MPKSVCCCFVQALVSKHSSFLFNFEVGSHSWHSAHFFVPCLLILGCTAALVTTSVGFGPFPLFFRRFSGFSLTFCSCRCLAAAGSPALQVAPVVLLVAPLVASLAVRAALDSGAAVPLVRPSLLVPSGQGASNAPLQYPSEALVLGLLDRTGHDLSCVSSMGIGHAQNDTCPPPLVQRSFECGFLS